MDRYEVFLKGDSWNWRLRKENGKSVQTGDGYRSRGDAITAARAGNTQGLSVVLLRKDGSEAGELDPAGGGGEAQNVHIDPAQSDSEAT